MCLRPCVGTKRPGSFVLSSSSATCAAFEAALGVGTAAGVAPRGGAVRRSMPSSPWTKPLYTATITVAVSAMSTHSNISGSARSTRIARLYRRIARVPRRVRKP